MNSLKLFALASSTVSAGNNLNVNVNGQEKQMYMVGSGSTDGQTAYTLHHNSGVKLMTTSGMDPNGFYRPGLVGGSIEYDIGLSQVDCRCNSAFYMVSAPAKNEDGSFNPSSGGDYYCDANNVGGAWCPEMDIQEANKYAFRMTPHRCDAPNSKGHYYNCDRGGCGKSIYEAAGRNAYGPGGQYRINTNNWFHVKIDFVKGGDRLTAIVLTLMQGSNSVSMTVADSDCAWGYLDAMKGPLESGMALVSSNWGGPNIDMSWLDGETGCGGNCGGQPSFTVSHIKYNLPREIIIIMKKTKTSISTH